MEFLTKHLSGFNIKDEMGWLCGTYEDGGNQYRVLVRISEVKRQLRLYKFRCKDNTKKNLKEMGLAFGGWINLFRESGGSL